MEEVVNLASSLITNLGFPIAVCCYLFYSNNKERESAREEREQEREAHAEEMDAMRSAVEANTEIISEIKATLNAFITLVNGGKEND